MKSEWIGIEINEVLADQAGDLVNKIEFSFKLLQLATSDYQKPNYETWKNLLVKTNPISIKHIEEEYSWLSLTDPNFAGQNHVSISLFLNQINPEREIVNLSKKQQAKIKLKFLEQLKKIS